MVHCHLFAPAFFAVDLHHGSKVINPMDSMACGGNKEVGVGAEQVVEEFKNGRYSTKQLSMG